MGLHQAVINSILSCETNATKQQLFKTIILTGGGAAMKGLGAMLQQQIIRNIPYLWSKLIEEVAVIERPKVRQSLTK